MPVPALRFGPFRMDPENASLWRGADPVRLTPKAFDVLRALVQRPGRLVTKEAFWRSVWPGVAVTEAALTVCIREIRQRLGDDARTPRFVETVHRRGFRFIAPVSADVGSDSGIEGLPSVPAGPVGVVAREREIARLREWLARARRGERQVVFVTGETGIGKTTLVEAFLAGAGEGSASWIACGQCIEHLGEGEAYLPVLDALERLCRDPGAEGALDRLRRHAPTWLTHMPGLVSETELEALRRRRPGATQDGMLREMDEVVAALTAERPLVLVLEDLHWSDRATLDLVVWLARRREPARLLLLGTYRPVDVIVRVHPVRAVARELRLHQRCEELSLELLTEADVAQHLALRFPGRRFPPELPRAIHRRTDGNPLFMAAVADVLVRQGWIHLVGDRWEAQPGAADAAMQIPSTLREMVEQRFEELAPELRRLLECASVAGGNFSAVAVAGGLEADLVVVDEQCAELARQGQFLQAAGVEAWPDETEAGCYRFVHALYQHVIYEAIRPGRRRELHRRIGARIESGYRARAPERAAELARHFLEGHDAARTVTYLRHAAQSALEQSAYHEGITHLRQGLAALHQLPDTMERAQDELDFLIALGPPLMAVEGIASAEVGETYSRAHELSQRASDTSLHLFGATWGLSIHHMVRGQLQTAHELANRLLSLAGEAPYAGHRPLAHMVAGNTLYYLGEMTHAREHMDQAVSLSAREPGRGRASRAGQEDPGVNPLLRLAWVLWAQGFPDQAVERCLDGLARARASSHSATITAALVYLARVFQFRREHDRAREHAEAALALASERGFAQRSAAAQILLGWARTEIGLDDGLDTMTKGIDNFRSTGAGDDLPYWLALIAAARGKVGQIDTALDAVAQGLEIVNGGGARVWEAELHRIKGELILDGSARQASEHAADRALEVDACFQQALVIARRQQARSLELRAALSLARTWRDRGRAAEARDLLAPVHVWFTEGFDTPDLREAQRLLDELPFPGHRARPRPAPRGSARRRPLA